MQIRILSGKLKKKISNKEKRSKKVASIKIKLLSQSWKEFRREAFFFFPR